MPALIPSWRFFDTIAPSPRIEFTRLETAQEPPEIWQEFRPRPGHLSFKTMLYHMIWNSHWNETLFLVSCAERIMAGQIEHSVQEIMNRIKAQPHPPSTPYLQFRLVFVHREGTDLQKHVTYISPLYHAGENTIL